ncbi:hypothetical protein [Photorhabdus viridis]|uniref:hypothetical protein n=1 Tax=Photorhabdus viridis TaxID=3163327 RepID=UPI003307931F
MSAVFKWDPNNSQVYTKDYVTQTIFLKNNDTRAEPYPFDKLGGANFIMNAEGETLTLQNDTDNIPIYWPEFIRHDDGTITDSGKGLKMNISAGKLIVDYKNSRDHTVAYLGCAESANFTLENTGSLEIIDPGTVFMFINYVIQDENKPPKLLMSGNSEFKITQEKPIKEDVPAFIFLASEIHLSESSTITFESNNLYLGDGVFNYCNISIQDNSIATLCNDGIIPKNDIENKKTKFNLMSGIPSLNIQSFSGTYFPLYIYDVEYPSGLFNFITEKNKKNLGKVMIDVQMDSKNNYDTFVDDIFNKKLITYNTEPDKKYFNVKYGSAFRKSHPVATITISLKPEYQ